MVLPTPAPQTAQVRLTARLHGRAGGRVRAGREAGAEGQPVAGLVRGGGFSSGVCCRAAARDRRPRCRRPFSALVSGSSVARERSLMTTSVAPLLPRRIGF